MNIFRIIILSLLILYSNESSFCNDPSYTPNSAEDCYKLEFDEEDVSDYCCYLSGKTSDNQEKKLCIGVDKEEIKDKEEAIESGVFDYLFGIKTVDALDCNSSSHFLKLSLIIILIILI